MLSSRRWYKIVARPMLMGKGFSTRKGDRPLSTVIHQRGSSQLAQGEASRNGAHPKRSKDTRKWNRESDSHKPTPASRNVNLKDALAASNPMKSRMIAWLTECIAINSSSNPPSPLLSADVLPLIGDLVNHMDARLIISTLEVLTKDNKQVTSDIQALALRLVERLVSTSDSAYTFTTAQGEQKQVLVGEAMSRAITLLRFTGVPFKSGANDRASELYVALLERALSHPQQLDPKSFAYLLHSSSKIGLRWSDLTPENQLALRQCVDHVGVEMNKYLPTTHPALINSQSWMVINGLQYLGYRGVSHPDPSMLPWFNHCLLSTIRSIELMKENTVALRNSLVPTSMSTTFALQHFGWHAHNLPKDTLAMLWSIIERAVPHAVGRNFTHLLKNLQSLQLRWSDFSPNLRQLLLAQVSAALPTMNAKDFGTMLHQLVDLGVPWSALPFPMRQEVLHVLDQHSAVNEQGQPGELVLSLALAQLGSMGARWERDFTEQQRSHILNHFATIAPSWSAKKMVSCFSSMHAIGAHFKVFLQHDKLWQVTMEGIDRWSGSLDVPLVATLLSAWSRMGFLWGRCPDSVHEVVANILQGSATLQGHEFATIVYHLGMMRARWHNEADTLADDQPDRNTFLRPAIQQRLLQDLRTSDVYSRNQPSSEGRLQFLHPRKSDAAENQNLRSKRTTAQHYANVVYGLRELKVSWSELTAQNCSEPLQQALVSSAPYFSSKEWSQVLMGLSRCGASWRDLHQSATTGIANNLPNALMQATDDQAFHNCVYSLSCMAFDIDPADKRADHLQSLIDALLPQLHGVLAKIDTTASFEAPSSQWELMTPTQRRELRVAQLHARQRRVFLLTVSTLLPESLRAPLLAKHFPQGMDEALKKSLAPADRKSPPGSATVTLSPSAAAGMVNTDALMDTVNNKLVRDFRAWDDARWLQGIANAVQKQLSDAGYGGLSVQSNVYMVDQRLFPSPLVILDAENKPLVFVSFQQNSRERELSRIQQLRERIFKTVLPQIPSIIVSQLQPGFEGENMDVQQATLVAQEVVKFLPKP